MKEMMRKDVGFFLSFLARQELLWPFDSFPPIRRLSLRHSCAHWGRLSPEPAPIGLGLFLRSQCRAVGPCSRVLGFQDQHAGNPWLTECLALHWMPLWSPCPLPCCGFRQGSWEQWPLIVDFKAQASPRGLWHHLPFPFLADLFAFHFLSTTTHGRMSEWEP